MAHKTNAVWTAGTGWVAKRETESAQYDNIGEGWAFLISFMRWFPDMLMDLFQSDNADYELTLIQRVMIRAKARYQYCDMTACRGATKSYTSIGEEETEGILWPGIHCGYYGPSFKQTAGIGSQTYRQLEKNYPGLAAHWTVNSEGKDSFKISTEYGSVFSIEAYRGTTIHKCCAEEYAQENPPAFDFEEYKQVVLPSIRGMYGIKGKKDPTYIAFKQHSITSAGRRQNHSYETRNRHLQMMIRGESAFVMDMSFEVILLSQMRPIGWAESNRDTLTPDEWAREMESRYTGADQNPVVRDEVLNEARCLLLMEEHHCCKDRDNKLLPQDVIYVVSYDVSYADGAQNAKCACVVTKLTKQQQWLKRDKYLKQIVWIDDWLPADPMIQAKRLKTVWYRFCYEGSQTYIAIDAWQYGSAVLQALMMNLDDGLAPLCTVDHVLYTEYELEGAVPVIYPIKAGGTGVTDPDSDMLRYAELQFENRNVQMLTQTWNVGVEAYKKYHRIKDDKNDYQIYSPYKKTNEAVGQIQNLKKVPSGAGQSEKRISNRIQRDSWSAIKYGLRVAEKLERKYLMKERKKSPWEEEYKHTLTGSYQSIGTSERSFGRVGGRRFI